MSCPRIIEIVLITVLFVVFVACSIVLIFKLKKEREDSRRINTNNDDKTPKKDKKKQKINSYLNCLLFFLILISLVGIIITICSFPVSGNGLKFDIIKSLDTPDWIGIWISVIDIMISFAMTYLIFKYETNVRIRQDSYDEDNSKKKKMIAVTQWASALNFNSCIVSNLYYKDPIELTVLNNVKQNYDGVVKIEFSSRTPLPIFLKFDINEIEINTWRLVNDDNPDSKIPAKFSSIKAIDNSCKKIDKKSDCLFRFYTSRSRTRFEFYLFYKENDSRKKEVAESLLYFSNHFEHINRIEMTITGSLSDKSGYYMVPPKKEPFSIKLLGRVQFEDGPSIEITTVNYSSNN